MTLTEYIKINFDGNRSDFARAQGTTRQHVNKWISQGFIVIDDQLYSKRRDLVRELKD